MLSIKPFQSISVLLLNLKIINMKKLFVVALLFVGLTNFAQERKGRTERAEMEQLTPEQRNQLHLKKLTLELDLTAAQQKEIASVIADESAKRETKMAERKAKNETKKALTANEKFEIKSKSLDSQIEFKAKMKKILNKEQMEKWEANKDKKIAHARKARKQNKEKPSKEVSE